jgi:open reading frame
MNCDIFQDQYLLLDKNESLPTGLKMHLLCCSSCRQAVNRMAAAENVQRHILRTPIAADERMLNATMRAIHLLNNQSTPVAARQEQNKTMLPWIAVGTFLIIGFILLPFSDMGKIDLSQFGDSFWIPFALLCAGSIVTYSAVFLAKNLVFFTEKFTRQV